MRLIMFLISSDMEAAQRWLVEEGVATNPEEPTASKRPGRAAGHDANENRGPPP